MIKITFINIFSLLTLSYFQLPASNLIIFIQLLLFMGYLHKINNLINFAVYYEVHESLLSDQFLTYLSTFFLEK